MILNHTQESLMNRSIALSLLAMGLAFAAAPASAVVYCKTVGVPKGCVARPVAKAPVAPAARAVAAPKPGNLNGGVNRAGLRR
ncbi:hypothetical protein [Candidatus Thiodictyon syntrophicum]|jgi:hypothetical protein|nr:hypothetical protein [Candidatus Thiodictyon syntrophicum]